MIQTINTIANYFMTAITLMTAFGVFLHDGRVDKATLTAAKYYDKPLVIRPVDVGGRFKDFVATDAHSHPDHNAAKSSLMSSFMYQSPSVPPRDGHNRRSLVQLLELRGRHAFDNANLPIIT